MGEVISVNFEKQSKAGYLLSDSGAVTAVYIGDSVISLVDGGAALATNVDLGLEYSDVLSVKEMNELCMMWLLINDPDVISCDEKL
jgi:hypothetical protein